MQRTAWLLSGALGGAYIGSQLDSSKNYSHNLFKTVTQAITHTLVEPFVCNAYTPQCEENMLFPSSFTTINPPRPPLPTLSSSLNVMEQAQQLDETLAYGLPSIDNIVVRRPYIASLSFQHRTPRWVAEYYRPGEFVDNKRRQKMIAMSYLDQDEIVTNDKNNKLDRKNYRFTTDGTVPNSFRVTTTDYLNSGYARGHMAPAAAHSYDEVDLLETFILNANIVPQDGEMNSGDWAKLESLTRSLTEHFRHVRVISGPAYLPKFNADGKRYVNYEIIGKNDVAVPTHLFKVIYVEEPISQAAISSVNSAFPGMGKHIASLSLPESSRGYSGSSVQDTSPQNNNNNNNNNEKNAQYIKKSKSNMPTTMNGIRTVYIAAFLLPNNNYANGNHLNKYIVPVSKIEKHTGLCLTPRTSPLSLTMTTS